MYKPAFHQVLVRLDTESDKWGTGNDDSMLGRSYNKGHVEAVGIVFTTDQVPMASNNIKVMLEDFEGKDILFNEGSEAGKTFEDEKGKLYALIDWWNIVGVKDADEA
jgi:hypothetical protein